MHTCEVCGRDMLAHLGEVEGVSFLIPPCCVGCACGSGDEAARAATPTTGTEEQDRG